MNPDVNSHSRWPTSFSSDLVCDLSAIFDSVNKVARACFSQIRHLKQIRRLLGPTVTGILSLRSFWADKTNATHPGRFAQVHHCSSTTCTECGCQGLDLVTTSLGLIDISCIVFTARSSYASAVLRIVILSVCPSITRVRCDGTKENTADILIPHERVITV